MTRVAAAAHVPGSLEEVRALWYDTSRWPAFVDGFAAVRRRDPRWPQEGELVWDSTPHGRGRVIERADGSFEDLKVAGTQEVRFEPEGDGVHVSVAVRYRLKERSVITPVVDRLFVRRAMADALTRTVRRFAAECAAEADLRAGRF